MENGQGLEVNRRVVLAARNIGVGHQGLVKFCAVMNMLPPMNENSFQDHIKAVRIANQTVAEKSMLKAADEVKEFYKPERDGVYNTAVSGDGIYFTGATGAMDAAGLATIFQRSVDKHSACYVAFLSDGDRKTHTRIVQEAVYGGVSVKKLEWWVMFRSFLAPTLVELEDLLTVEFINYKFIMAKQFYRTLTTLI